MGRAWAGAVIGLVLLGLGCASPTADQGRPRRDVAGAEWAVQADLVDCCCCQPSCPCLFGSAPTLGYCEGVSLVEIKSGHFGDVPLDGVKVLAVYRGGTWIKFHVDEGADKAQTDAAVKLLPTMEKFFAIKDVLEVKNVPITVERSGEALRISTPESVVEMEVMKGKNGKPIRIANMPSASFPAPPYHDHTQYRSVTLKHRGGDKEFEYTGTNGFTARLDEVAPGH